MADIKVGASVTFHRSHDTQHALVGTVKEVRGEEVLITAEPGGVAMWANAAHVKVSGVKRRTEDQPARAETAGEEAAREAAEQGEEDAEDVQPQPQVSGKRAEKAHHKV
jgi:hypothetical protein